MEDAKYVFNCLVFENTKQAIENKAAETGMPVEEIAGKMLETGFDIIAAESFIRSKIKGYLDALKGIHEIASPVRRKLKRTLFPEKPLSDILREKPFSEMFSKFPEANRPFRHFTVYPSSCYDRVPVEVIVSNETMGEITDFVESCSSDEEGYLHYFTCIDLMALDPRLFEIDVKTLESFCDQLQELISCNQKLRSDSNESITAIIDKVNENVLPFYKLLIDGKHAEAVETAKDWMLPFQVEEK